MMKLFSNPPTHIVSMCMLALLLMECLSCMLVAGTTKHKSEHKTQHGKPARSITKFEYREVLQNTLLHEGTKLFKKACISEWFMQQDNDSCHNVASQIVQY